MDVQPLLDQLSFQLFIAGQRKDFTTIQRITEKVFQGGLSAAVSANNSEWVKYFLELGAIPDEILYQAALRQNSEVADVLLQYLQWTIEEV